MVHMALDIAHTIVSHPGHGAEAVTNWPLIAVIAFAAVLGWRAAPDFGPYK